MKYNDPELKRINKFTRRLFGFDRWVVKYVNHEYTLYSMRRINRRQNDGATINLRKSKNSCMYATICYSFGGDIKPVIDKWAELLEIERKKMRMKPDYYKKKSIEKLISEIIYV
jgi:hypothetical protein